MIRIIAVDQSLKSDLLFEISLFTGKTTQILSALQGVFPSSDLYDSKFRRKIQIVKSITCPWLFPEGIISCWILILYNAIWRVNAFEVSLVFFIRWFFPSRENEFIGVAASMLWDHNCLLLIPPSAPKICPNELAERLRSKISCSVWGPAPECR